MALERAGIPACALVSEAFLPQAVYQGRQVGAESDADVRRLLVAVKHPISDQTVEQMHEKADACFDMAVRAVTRGLTLDESAESGLPVASAGECAS